MSSSLDITLLKVLPTLTRACDEGSTCDRTLRRWLLEFRSGNTGLHSRYLKRQVEQNPCQSCREMSQIMGFSIPTISDNFKLKNLVTCVSYKLNESQCFEVCPMLHVWNDPILDRLVTCNEKWFFYDNFNDWLYGLIMSKDPIIFQNRKGNNGRNLVIIWWSAIGVIHSGI